MRNRIIAGLAVLAAALSVGAAMNVSPAQAGVTYAEQGAYRDVTDLCVYWFPNTCHGVAKLTQAGPFCCVMNDSHNYPVLVISNFWNFKMRFQAWIGTRQETCYRYLSEDTWGAFAKEYSPIECYWM